MDTSIWKALGNSISSEKAAASLEWRWLFRARQGGGTGCRTAVTLWQRRSPKPSSPGFLTHHLCRLPDLPHQVLRIFSSSQHSIGKVPPLSLDRQRKLSMVKQFAQSHTAAGFQIPGPPGPQNPCLFLSSLNTSPLQNGAPAKRTAGAH